MLRRITQFLMFLVSLVLTTPVFAANRFAVCTVTCTWDASSTAMWSTSTGGATGASAPGSADVAILDGATCVGGVTCTVTMTAGVNPTFQSITSGACTASTTGCIIDYNGNNVTLTSSTGYAGSGNGTRDIRLGAGTWTLSGSSATWDMTTSTGLTFSAASSTINFSSTTPSASRVLATGGKTFGTVTVPANTTGFQFGITGTISTIGTLTVTGAGNVQFPNGTTTTVTNLNINGSSGNPIAIFSAASANATIAVTSATVTWASLRFLAVTGTLSATNSFDLGGNSGAGLTISAPSGGGSGKCIGC